jgi:glycosyltransferase involved in cell wall biosynthesis
VKVCLVSPGPEGSAETSRAVALLAELLGRGHEVAVVEPGEPSEEVRALTFACEAHRRSAATMEAIRRRYGATGPDYLELPDREPLGFVALQARRGGEPLLERTLVGVRAGAGAELRALHDTVLSETEQTRAAELEREQLRRADRLIWPGGDVLGLYQRYYGGEALPPALRIGLPIVLGPEPSPPPARALGEPLRILCLGDLWRHRGPLDLLAACRSQSADGWELTLAGRDTPTATMGQSVRASLEAMAGGDPRVRFEDEIPVADRRRRLGEFDLVALPARVEGWSEPAVEAMGAGVPVLATPVGGLVELVADGVTGWLADGIGPDPLRRRLARLLEQPDAVERMRRSGAIRSRLARLADPEPILDAYERIAAAATERAGRLLPRDPETPLVTAIVPYFGASEFIAEAVGSLLGQTHRRLEVLIVNDGSFDPADAVLDQLATDPRVTVVTQPNEGESAARNLGAALARGEYLVMLDADNLLEPHFVARALRAFGADPQLAYVTCWLRMIDRDGVEMPAGHGYAPLGNGVVEDDARNWDGDTIAMFPRRLFVELGYGYGPEGSMHSDWELYRWLRSEGQIGTVIPERLARYRVLPDSLLRAHGAELRQRGWNESRDRNRARRVRWIANRPG